MDTEHESITLSHVVRELAQSSAIHGIPKIATSRQVTVKVLWCVLLVAAFAVMTVQLLELFRTFNSNPVQTTVSLDFSTLDFPAISFCNMNPIRKSKIGISKNLQETIYPKKGKSKQKVKESREKRQLDSETSSVKNLFNDMNSVTISNNPDTDTEKSTATDATTTPGSTPGSIYDLDEYYGYYGWDIFGHFDEYMLDNISLSEMNMSYEYDEDLVQHFSDPQDKWDLVITNFKINFRNVSVEKRKQMGHQRDDFIQYASFARREQNISAYFSQFTTADYGNCYTMDNPKYKAWGSGSDSGIKLTLYLEVDEYIENYSSGYGVRVVFHERGTFPMPAKEGLTLSPGYETSIGLRAINVTRLGDPYGSCTQSGNADFRRKYNIVYSKTACLGFCRVENVISQCDCIPFDAPDMEYGVDLPVCRHKDEWCVNSVDYKFEKGALGCDCISPCTEFVYSMTMSGRVWPHRDFLENVLMKDICAKNVTSLQSACAQIQNKSTDFNYERYKNNFVHVLIYFEDLNYEQITEQPFYTLVRFVSDIGGAMGLFVGVSLLSLFEVLQLILEIALYFMGMHKRSTKNNEQIIDKKKDICTEQTNPML